MEQLPTYTPIVFCLTTLLTLALFFNVLHKSELSRSNVRRISIVLIAWLLIQMVIAISGFYATNTTSLPPRFFLALSPPLILMICLFLFENGKAFMDKLPLYEVTWVNVVRIPVEFVLYWLFLQGTVPELMTFAGRNFDIIAGLTAPFVAYFGFRRKNMGRKILLLWNILMLALLLWIVVNAMLSAPIAFQQFAFDQPNIAVFYFPYNFLVAFIVPAVIFGHLVSIRQLSRS